MDQEDLVGSGEHLVVVVAHPDDESFGCGSLIAAASAGGARVTVVCATRGEAGERVSPPETDAVPLGELRERELRDAARVLGVTTVELLGHADSGFDGPLAAEALCAADPGALAEEIDPWLRDADVVLVLDGSDGHRDHRHVRAAVEAALAGRERSPRLVQSCLANSLMRRWVEETRSLQPDAAYLDIDVAELGRPDAELTAVDTGRFLDVREAAIACHRSQRSPYEGLSPDLRRAFLGTDFVVVT